ncbi:MAG: bifunctional phosphopantothenoylcysteine decarboxylase/phosphopantothenate--cysteine ligase CoaBC [Desulfurococcaceae archaeon]
MKASENSMTEHLGAYVYQPLSGKKIILGVTGSSSVYRSIDLARRLIRMGASIKVIMTKSSTKFVGPDLFHWATGNKPYIEMTGETEHIDLARWADAMVIAPSTLNTMSKIAYGVLDELLPLTAVTMLGDNKKTIIVPAMNMRLLNSPQYRRVHDLLREQEAILIPPLIEEDKAKYPPIDDLSHCIDAIVNRGRDLEGLKILVTAGATREYIDPVRVITNKSSGLMGILIAREAACRGADVTLVHGALNFNPPYLVQKIRVETTIDMVNVVKDLTENIEYDIALFSAAPADYKPLNVSETKIQTRRDPRLTIELEATPKVIKNMVKKPRVLVGFAAETVSGEELIERANEKLKDYELDIVVANNVLSDIAGFGKEFLDAYVIGNNKIIAKGILTKYEIARLLLDHALEYLKRKIH